MNTLSPRSSSSSILIFVGLLLVIGLLYWQYYATSELSFKSDRPVVSEHYGEQLELPFEDMETIPKPEKKPFTPAYSRRYDEERKGTCIIYALIAPTDGLYHVPGCYGKPASLQFFSFGKILKIGRHWNKSLPRCLGIERLSGVIRNKRYRFDTKFPGAKIRFKDSEGIASIPMNIQIIDCFEDVMEGECEEFEKDYIKQNGGAKNLPLNCCCR